MRRVIISVVFVLAAKLALAQDKPPSAQVTNLKGSMAIGGNIVETLHAHRWIVCNQDGSTIDGLIVNGSPFRASHDSPPGWQCQ